MSSRIPEYSRYVSSITITHGGSGYGTGTTITISGGGGTGATATASVFNGIIQTVTITDEGSGYTTSPTVTVTGGGGSGAVLVAVLSFAALPTTEYQEISSLGIKYTLPEFIREDYPDFVTFLEKYYEFMDQTNKPGHLLLNKRYYDIDDLNDAELNKKALEFAKDFPQVLAIEKKKLYKNIKSLYESKGSERSIKAFFRLLYDEEIELSYPTQFILRASDGVWQQDSSVKVLLGYEDHRPTNLYAKAIDILYYETIGYTGSIPNRRAITEPKRISTAVVRANKIAYTTPSKYELFLELPRYVTSIPGPGTGAAATLTIVSGVITAVTLTSGGSGYLAAPDVIITSTGSGVGADIVAIVENGSVTGFIINSGGSSYVSGTTTIAFNAHSINSTVAISGTAGQFTCGKSAIAVGDQVKITGTLGGTGTISGYTSGNVYKVSAISGSVTRITVTSGGSGYTSNPTVAFSGGGGSGATATATRTGNIVTSINVTNGGSGYTSAPTITITGGGGSGATATSVAPLPAVTSFTLTATDDTAIVTTAGSLTGLTYTVNTKKYYETVILLKDAENLEQNIKGYITRCLTSVISGSYANYSVPSVDVTAGGSGYTSNPTVAFSGGGGSGAAATAERGKVTGITVTAAGSGYTSDPTVTIGSVATATATRTDNTVTGITLTAVGSGYTSAPTITISGGGGSGATAIATLSSRKSGNIVTSITVTNEGSGYTSNPTVTISGGGGSGATATAVRGKITGITVTSGGSGYTNAPTVAFSGGGGSGATATATLTGNVVTSITVTAGGSGYTSVPTVAFSGGVDTGARATAVRGTVTGITVTAGGSGYTTVPTVLAGVAISGTAGQFTCTATTLAIGDRLTITGTLGGTGTITGYTTGTVYRVSAITGSVSAVTGFTLQTPEGFSIVTTAGTPTGLTYTSVLTVTISGGGGSGATATATLTGNVVTSITVTAGGSGYTSNPTVTISGGGGSGAAATAVRETVTNITVKNEGSGYTSNPTVTISGGGGSGATATAVRGKVTSITVSNEGSGYSSAPTVTFTGGAGSGATATAVLQSDAGFKIGDVFSFAQTENDLSYFTVKEVDEDNVPTSWTILAPGSGYTSASTTDTITSDTGETLQITLSSDYLFLYDGKYKNDRGKTSSLNILQDNFKFQNYSYIIKSSLPQYIWNDVFREHMHPAGKEVFGDLFLISDLDISIEFSTTGLKLNEFITEDLTDASDALVVSFSTTRADSTTNSDTFTISIETFFTDSVSAAEIDFQDYGPEDYFPEAYTGIVAILKTVEKSLLDSSITSDAASINMSWNRTFTDPFGFGTNPSTDDIVVIETTWTRSFEDSTTEIDDIAVIETARSIADSTTAIDDIVVIETTWTRSFEDSTVAINDTVAIETTWTRSFEDSTVAINDTDAIETTWTRSFEDSATASDSGVITLLSYIDPTYFSEDYVGEVTNIT
jgi:hypothetical protein